LHKKGIEGRPIHAVVDDEGRPRAFLLTGRNVDDIKGAAPLLASTAASKHIIADKGYEARPPVPGGRPLLLD
jgi:transposase